ncbi:MAG: GIY-YIG nuclease family protein [Verrucomicrobiota bacterium]
MDLEAVDALCPGESWDARLRIHHALGKLYFQHDAPSYVYSSFHVGLRLNKYNYEEFIRAWVVKTLGNWRLTESLKKSPDHIVLVRAPGMHISMTGRHIMSPDHIVLVRAPGSYGYIFRKTPFVLARLAIVSEENKKRADEAERQANWRAEEAEREAKQRFQKAELWAAEEAARRKRLSEKPSSSEPCYVITLAPGVVRYLEVALFLEADVVHWVGLLRGLCPEPKIRPPSHLSGIDKLLPDLSWEDRLHAHHALGRLELEHGLPSSVYCCFHSELKLTAPALDACLNAWVTEAWDNRDVEESFVGGSDHLVLPGNASSSDRRCVFRKTPFIAERLAALEREAQLAAKRMLEVEAMRKETDDLDRLRKSSFATFVYVMEDLRNGHFKIGRSMSPGKRERTLQSEVPQIVLRLSIPADEGHERELHDHFADKRLRGEWFSLAPDDLQWLVSFLRRNGDAARASIDYQWLGTIIFNANDNSGGK